MKILKFLRILGLYLMIFVILTVGLFISFQIWPHLPHRLGLGMWRYYAAQDLILDPDLVFRPKPNSHYEATFFGDHYCPFSPNPTRPLFYEANYDAEGFRNQGKPAQNEIVIIGDSLIQYGLNEEDTLAARVEKISGLSTASYGMEWCGPPQYLAILKKFALKRRPKVVILSFFEGNDLRDIPQYKKWKETGQYYTFDLRKPQNSFQRYITMVEDLILFSLKLVARTWDPRLVQVQIPGQTFHSVLVYPADLRTPEEFRRTEEIRDLKNIFEEFKRLSEEYSFVPVILFVPTATHIDLPFVLPETFKGGRASLQKQIESRNHVAQIVGQLSLETGLRWIDLSDYFEKLTSEGKMIYYPWDTHWTSEGKQSAAEEIVRALKHWQTNALSQSNPPEPSRQPHG